MNRQNHKNNIILFFRNKIIGRGYNAHKIIFNYLTFHSHFVRTRKKSESDFWKFEQIYLGPDGCPLTRPIPQISPWMRDPLYQGESKLFNRYICLNLNIKNIKKWNVTNTNNLIEKIKSDNFSFIWR